MAHGEAHSSLCQGKEGNQIVNTTKHKRREAPFQGIRKRRATASSHRVKKQLATARGMKKGPKKTSGTSSERRIVDNQGWTGCRISYKANKRQASGRCRQKKRAREYGLDDRNKMQESQQRRDNSSYNEEKKNRRRRRRVAVCLSSSRTMGYSTAHSILSRFREQ